MMLSAGFLFTLSIGISENASATSYVAQYVGAAVNGTWVKVNTSGPVNIDIVPTATGTLGINKSEVSVETNANTGYRLYLSGINSEANGYTALYRNGNPSDISKFTSVTSEPTSPTSLTNGQWGWALPASAVGVFPAASAYENLAAAGSTTDSSIINNLKFAGIKQNYTFVKSTNTSNESNPDNLNIYYGALADNSMTIGSYYNVIVYTAFVEGADTISVSPSTIADGDTMTIATNLQGNATPITNSQIEISLYDSSNPNTNIGTCDNVQITKDGTAGNPLELTCIYHKGTDAAANTSYNLTLKVDPAGNGVYLSYSADSSWRLDIAGKTMQEFSCQDAAPFATSGKTYALEDTRDGKYYAIRKLADNKCWMVQNLALEGGKSLSSTDSNLPSGATYITPDGSDYSGKFSDNNAEHMYNGTHKDAQNDNTSDNTGAYYNWNVATAGYDTAGEKSSGKSDRSICPKGWRLPTSKSSGEFQALYTAYGSNKSNLDAAFNTFYTGYYSDGSLETSGSRAYWWSSTINSNTYAYNLFESSNGSLRPSDSDDRYYGYSVRCVAADTRTLEDIFNIREVTAEICSNTPLYSESNKTYTLSGHSVRRLSDGNCWTVSDVGNTTWANAPAKCGSLGREWALPSRAQYRALVDAGLTASAWNSSGSGYHYWWSSTENGNDRACGLALSGGGFYISDSNGKTSTYPTRCVLQHN